MMNCQNVHRNLPVLLKNSARDEAINTDNLVKTEPWCALTATDPSVLSEILTAPKPIVLFYLTTRNHWKLSSFRTKGLIFFKVKKD